MRTIAQGGEAVRLPYTANDGTKPIVVTTPAESVEDVMIQVKRAGGHANVAVALAKQFRIIVMFSDLPEQPKNDLEVNRDMSMGMFLIHVGRTKKNRASFGWRQADQAPAMVPSAPFEYAR